MSPDTRPRGQGRRPHAGENVLVVGDELEREPTESYLQLLASPVERPGELNLVRVVYTSSLSELCEMWTETVGGPPNHLHVIRAQDRQLGAVDEGDVPGWLSTTAINPNDLTGLAIRVRDALSELTTDSTRLSLGFDSLTPLLQYNDVTATYKFLHLVTGQLSQANATSAFRLDPRAFDDRTVNKLRSLFDDEVRIEG